MPSGVMFLRSSWLLARANQPVVLSVGLHPKPNNRTFLLNGPTDLSHDPTLQTTFKAPNGNPPSHNFTLLSAVTGMKKALFVLLTLPLSSLGANHRFDVVVYGGTAGGVMAAVSAAREGLNTALLEPGHHIGGMVSGGLELDGLRQEGSHRRLRVRVLSARRPALSAGGLRTGDRWIHEPHVAERYLSRDAARGRQDFRAARLREKDGVRKKRRAGRRDRLRTATSFAAKMFIDCSYEGDLMAQAGVTLHVGPRRPRGIRREPGGRAGEDAHPSVHAGKSRPIGDAGDCSPRSAAPLAAPGTADARWYRHTTSASPSPTIPNNRVAFPKPSGLRCEAL